VLKARALALLCLVLSSGRSWGATRSAESPGGLVWREWSAHVFEEAARENRFVLLDLEAVWCHWCHVMAETSYKDPKVVALIEARYIPVRVDQDSRPDISNRYEDYGWPATVIFGGNGQELVKFSGYIPPLRMASLLQGVIDDPTPGPSAQTEPDPRPAVSAALTAPLKEKLEEARVSRYDPQNAGWGTVHKFLDWDSVEYSMLRAQEGDAGAERMARDTLLAQLKLVDPVWGGVYQYSHGGNWDNPHFEKIMSMQAEDMRIYAQAYAQWHDPRYLKAAEDIHRYLRGFLVSPDGAFYTSQDADLVPGEHAGEYFALDDAGRRAKGIPRVDTHRYARENGWAANALAVLYGVTGDEATLGEALRAAEWIVKERALPSGGFRHDAKDAGGPYLGDTLAAGRAFLSLYAATGDRAWLARAEDAAGFIDLNFKREGMAGIVTAQATSPLEPVRPQRDENILTARFTNLLSRSTGKPAYRRTADDAMGYLALPDVATRFETSGVLLVDRELRTEPLHVTVVGPKDDPVARALLLAALKEPSSYKRVELWDRRDGPLPYQDVEFPSLKTPAAYLCSQGRCSRPARTPEELQAKLGQLHQKPVSKS
jgi:uncharacterized protein